MNILFDFYFSGDSGAAPDSLVQGPDGSYVGAASEYGQYGYGTLFQMNPPAVAGGAWTETILYDFPADVGFPAGLVRDKDGLLGVAGAVYGITTAGADEIFQLTPTVAGGAWSYSVIHSGHDFNLTLSPQGALFFTENYQLAQLTQSGGVWTFTPVYTFSENETPGGLAVDAAGNVYGAVYSGGSGYGEVVKLVPPSQPGGNWTETVIHTFSGTDGTNPWYLIVDGHGNLYGTTRYGGGHANGGVTFRLAPNSSGTYNYRSLYRFTGSSTTPSSPTSLAFFHDELYGFTEQSGYSFGSIYKLSISGGVVTETTLVNFGAATGNSNPAGKPLFASDGSIFGVTESGGPDDGGTFYQFVP
jgi:hypothetical protein